MSNGDDDEEVEKPNQPPNREMRQSPLKSEDTEDLSEKTEEPASEKSNQETDDTS